MSLLIDCVSGNIVLELKCSCESQNLELGFESLSSLSTSDFHFLLGELYFFFLVIKSCTQAVPNSCLLEGHSFPGKSCF